MIPKVHYPGEHDALLQSCGGQIAQFFFPGEMRKAAASSLFSRAKLAEFTPPAGKFGVHLVGIGEEETYGPNRNGDGFDKQALADRTHTFITHGRFYRDHRNRGEKDAIGEIKAAAVNPELRRAELIVWGDNKKAEPEYERARMGKNSSYSMSCKIAADVCSCCGQKSANTSEYCDHLKNHMLQYLPEFQKYAYAKNPKPTFFDISDVTNTKPADRIAHHLQYMLPQTKAASATPPVMNGAECAVFEGVNLPDEDLQTMPAGWLKLAHQVIEQVKKADADSSGPLQAMRKLASRLAASHERLTDSQIDHLRSLGTGACFHELAKRAALMPLLTFQAYVTGEPQHQIEADPVFLRARDKQAAAISLAVSRFADACPLVDEFTALTKFASEFDPANDDLVQRIMDEAGSAFGIKTEALTHRIQRVDCPAEAPAQREITINIKSSALDEDKLLAVYGLYKLAAGTEILKLNPGLSEPLLHLMLQA